MVCVILSRTIWKKEPCSDYVFVFCGRARDKVKILQWSHNGFWLHYKSLEKGIFQWPGIDDENLSIQVSSRQLNWLLDGLPANEKSAMCDRLFTRLRRLLKCGWLSSIRIDQRNPCRLLGTRTSKIR
ncbi:IS66 family insertion sequence element accessory protein TnpB [Marinomonas ushuaiensis]|uniref:IS66 family insertion sequence element accessory protein TnpB n=1 Tax=Marinomonas ushuaiensis TaxID=263818 RepID=UPI0012EBBDFB